MDIPHPIQRLYDFWVMFSRTLGLVMSWILLTILWLTVIALYAIVMKIITLFRRQRRLQTYWIPLTPESAKQMHRPF